MFHSHYTFSTLAVPVLEAIVRRHSQDMIGMGMCRLQHVFIFHAHCPTIFNQTVRHAQSRYLMIACNYYKTSFGAQRNALARVQLHHLITWQGQVIFGSDQISHNHCAIKCRAPTSPLTHGFQVPSAVAVIVLRTASSKTVGPIHAKCIDSRIFEIIMKLIFEHCEILNKTINS